MLNYSPGESGDHTDKKLHRMLDSPPRWHGELPNQKESFDLVEVISFTGKDLPGTRLEGMV